jgi:hypothetical protein
LAVKRWIGRMLGKRSDGWNDRGWVVQLECSAARLRLIRSQATSH